MDVRHEWNDFIEQASEYPEGLSGVEDRLKARIAGGRKKRKAVFGSLSAVAAALIFVVLVNVNTAFADSIADLPLIGDLAEFVKFDKGLSNAIKNDYVQKVDLIAWDGDKQLLLPYVIADEKNLVLFFRLPKEFELKENQAALVSLQEMKNGDTGEEITGASSHSLALSSEDAEKGAGFLLQGYYFTDGNLPQSVRLKVNLEVEASVISRTIGTFSFEIHFKEFAKPRIYEFQKEYSILGQQLTLEEVKVYPAGTEVSFTFPDGNSAWIKGLDLAIEQNGKIISEGISNGVKGGHSSTMKN